MPVQIRDKLGDRTPDGREIFPGAIKAGEACLEHVLRQMSAEPVAMQGIFDKVRGGNNLALLATAIGAKLQNPIHRRAGGLRHMHEDN